MCTYSTCKLDFKNAEQQTGESTLQGVCLGCGCAPVAMS